MDFWEEVTYIKQALVSKLVVLTKRSAQMGILVCLSGHVTVSLCNNGAGAAILHLEEIYEHYIISLERNHYKKLFLGLKVLMFDNSLGEKILIPMVNTTQMGVIN